jgi:DNA mismatch repair protein MSH6
MVSLLNNIQACYVEEAQEKVVFLYKLKPGACPASFGINVARVTGIPNSVLEKAKQKAATFE